MRNLTLDIFSGELEKDASWLEAVQGLAGAKERMKQIAAERPGKYFIFCVADSAVLESMDTLANADPRREKRAAWGS
jgi:hypothetical protein